jgi:hypothetical protein
MVAAGRPRSQLSYGPISWACKTDTDCVLSCLIETDCCPQRCACRYAYPRAFERTLQRHMAAKCENIVCPKEQACRRPASPSRAAPTARAKRSGAQQMAERSRTTRAIATARRATNFALVCERAANGDIGTFGRATRGRTALPLGLAAEQRRLFFLAKLIDELPRAPSAQVSLIRPSADRRVATRRHGALGARPDRIHVSHATALALWIELLDAPKAAGTGDAGSERHHRACQN